MICAPELWCNLRFNTLFLRGSTPVSAPHGQHHEVPTNVSAGHYTQNKYHLARFTQQPLRVYFTASNAHGTVRCAFSLSRQAYLMPLAMFRWLALLLFSTCCATKRGPHLRSSRQGASRARRRRAANARDGDVRARLRALRLVGQRGRALSETAGQAAYLGGLRVREVQPCARQEYTSAVLYTKHTCVLLLSRQDGAAQDTPYNMIMRHARLGSARRAAGLPSTAPAGLRLGLGLGTRHEVHDAREGRAGDEQEADALGRVHRHAQQLLPALRRRVCAPARQGGCQTSQPLLTLARCLQVRLIPRDTSRNRRRQALHTNQPPCHDCVNSPAVARPKPWAMQTARSYNKCASAIRLPEHQRADAAPPSGRLA
jgi:hypothetical protein